MVECAVFMHDILVLYILLLAQRFLCNILLKIGYGSSFILYAI